MRSANTKAAPTMNTTSSSEPSSDDPAWSPDGSLRSRFSITRARLDPLLLDSVLLADLVAEVVELGPVHVADGQDLELIDLGRVHGEGTLDSHAERLLAHREGLADAFTLALDADALEHLDPLAHTLDDLEVHLHRVPGLEAGNVVS